MNTTITLAELIGFSITVLGSVIIAWINIRIKVTALEVQVLQIEKDIASEKTSNKHEFDKLGDKMDACISSINDVKLELKDKANR